MSVPADSLEAKIREAEERLGIRPVDGVAIHYERKSEDVGYIIYALFIMAVFAVIFALSKNIRVSENNGLRSQTRLYTALKNCTTQVSITKNNPFESMRQAAFTLIDPKIRWVQD